MWKPPRFPGQTFSFYKKCPQHADLKLCLWLKYQGWFLVRSYVLCIVTIEAWQSHSSRSESRSLIFLPFLCVCNALEFFLRKKRGLGLLSNAFSYNPVFIAKWIKLCIPKSVQQEICNTVSFHIHQGEQGFVFHCQHPESSGPVFPQRLTDPASLLFQWKLGN